MSRLVRYLLVLVSFLAAVPVSSAQESKKENVIRYRIGKSVLDTAVSGNSLSLKDLAGFFRTIENSSVTVTRVDIFSSASMEGDVVSNKRLNKRRNDRVRDYIRSISNLPDSLIHCHDNGIAWDELRVAVTDSDMKYKDEVIFILDNQPEETWRAGVLVDSRNKRLMDLRGGRPYRFMRREFFPDLRYTEVEIAYTGELGWYPDKAVGSRPIPLASVHHSVQYAQETAVVAGVSRLSDVQSTVCSGENENEAVSPGIILHDPTVSARPYIGEHRPLFSVKTNALFLGTGVTNVGVEVGFKKNFSVEVPMVYSPYTIHDNYRIRILGFQPEVRYWFNEYTKGHFVGIHGNVAWYNVSFSGGNRYQDAKDRPLMGIGLSYGYSLNILPFLSLEFTLGVGYANMHYDVFYNVKNGICYDSGVRNYWGITKAGISLVYVFNHRK